MTDDPIRAAFEAYMRADGWTNHGLLRDKEYADAQIQLAFEYYRAGHEAARAAALEEAASECDAEASIEGIAQRCAARIRALGAK